MKNEVIARAITEIDDELIVSAHRTAYSKSKKVMLFSALAAACLLLICGSFFFLNHSTDEKPKIVFGEAVISAHQSKIATYDLWQTSQTVITVPIEINFESEFDIAVDGGIISVYSAETDEQIYVGQSCETKGAVKVEWTIDDPDTNRNYLIKISFDKVNKNTVYMLRYNETNDKWSITETEEK